MRNTLLWGSLAVVAVLSLCLSGAIAGEDVPAAAKPAKTDTAPAPTTAEVKTKTETPLCSMMGWIGEQVKQTKGVEGDCCGGAMKAWFAGGADVPLAGMRDRLVADGWTAETTIAFFKKMQAERAAKSGADCQGCDKAKDCGGCDKAGDAKIKTATGDAAPAGDCGGCDKAKDCSGCDKATDCGGCDKAKKDAKPVKENVGS